MKRLHRLVIYSFLGPFVMTFFIVLFLLLMQFLWRYIDELVGKGLEMKVIGELLVYASSSLVPLALPLAILLSSLMAFGNMGEFYELTAMKSSGISLRRIMLPVIFLVVLISIGAFFFSNNVLPFTNLKMKSLLYDVRQQRPEVQITEGVFYNGIDNYSIRVSRKDPVTNMLYDIKIYDHSANKGNISVTTADSGRMKMTADRRNLVVTLWSGYTYKELAENRRRRDNTFPHQLERFGEQRIIIAMSGFELNRSDESIFRNSYTMLNIEQLARARDSLELELVTKSRQFYKSLMRDNYFRMNSPENARFTSVAQPALLQAPPPTPKPTAGRETAAGNLNENRDRLAEMRQINRTEGADLTRGERKPRSRIVDSVQLARPVKKINDFDSLFDSYPADKQAAVLQSAISYASMNQYMVANTASNIKFDVKYLRRHEIEWHRKFTLSFACLIFLFIGAPLGAIIRKGGLGMPTVISTLLFIMYYIISLTGEKFVRESVLSSFQGMWLSSFILVIAGVFLTYEATNDSAILNIDTYLNWVRDRLGLRKGMMLDKKAHLTGKFELLDIPRKELQEEFAAIGLQARECHKNIKKDTRLYNMAHSAIFSQGCMCLIEFSIDYNSLIDRIILSTWFRIPYFQKRLSEFPVISSHLTTRYFKNKTLKILSFIVFPVWIILLVHLWLRGHRLRRYLMQVSDLSTGMINLLNSSALKIESEIAA